MIYSSRFKINEFLFVFILAVVLSFLVFGNGINGDFVFDDVSVVENRGDLKEMSNFFNLFTSAYHQNMPKTGLYRPFTMATYSLNHNIFSSSPISFHIVNIVIHALNSFLVFWLISWFFKSRPAAYISSLLFLLHPIHTEAVTSIVGRAELLAFFWSLTAIYFFSKHKKTLAAVAFLFGLMSKEVALTVLPVIFYLDVIFLNKSWRRALLNNLFFIFPLALYSFLRYLALGQYFMGGIKTTVIENTLKFVSLPERIFTALKVLFLYAEKLIWPIHLSADYSYNAIPVVRNIFGSPQASAGLLILLIILMAMILPKLHKTGLGLGAAIFFFPYLMISNLIIPVGTIMGERLMYFPSLGFVIVLALLCERIVSRAGFYKKAGYGILLAILIFYGARTIIRNKDWRDSRTLFYATLKESPNGLITRTALAGVHIRAGEWDRAKAQLGIASSIYEDNSHLQNLLGVVADHAGNFKLAEEKYKKSIELNLDAINSYINLAELYLKQGRLEEAGDNFKKVIAFYPVTEYVIRYSYIQIALNKPDNALETITKYFGNELNHSDLNVLAGTAYFVKKQYDKALPLLLKAQALGNKAPEIEEMIKIIRQI